MIPHSLYLSNLLRAFFLHSAITYKVVIVTGKQLGGSTTTANVWMILAGEIKDTGSIDVPKGECEFRFQVRLQENFIILKWFFLQKFIKNYGELC